jgi:hypothetical protein
MFVNGAPRLVQPFMFCNGTDTRIGQGMPTDRAISFSASSLDGTSSFPGYRGLDQHQSDPERGPTLSEDSLAGVVPTISTCVNMTPYSWSHTMGGGCDGINSRESRS